ncbi:uncharacterized protein G2W53_041072 [Senna tora]|uniref:Uncharacterized protein n=1 Tax=Senna tora TaxID=362788 RepID=A0A834SEJ3_9FABA|nr:uncharacterized protein G2W53_041072 [Senna tora]
MWPSAGSHIAISPPSLRVSEELWSFSFALLSVVLLSTFSLFSLYLLRLWLALLTVILPPIVSSFMANRREMLHPLLEVEGCFTTSGHRRALHDCLGKGVELHSLPAKIRHNRYCFPDSHSLSREPSCP